MSAYGRGALLCALVVPFLSVPSAGAEGRCKIKIDKSTGALLVSASGVGNNATWGQASGEETNSFETACAAQLGTNEPNKCKIADDEEAARIPPAGCVLYVAGDSDSCSTFIRGCTPGTRTRLQSKRVLFTHDASDGTGPQPITGVGFQPTSVIVNCGIANVAYTTAASVGLVDENGSFGDLVFSDVDTSSVGSNFVVDVNPDGASSSTAAIASLDADGFTLNWTTTDHDVSCIALALR